MGMTRLTAALIAGLTGGWLIPALADDLPAGPFNAEAHYPEGPLIHNGALYYAEMTADRVVRWDGAGRATFFEMKGCGPTSISPYGEDRFAVTCHSAGAIALVSADGEGLEELKFSIDGERLSLPNDSYSDRRGGVYFSSSGPFAIRAQPSGRVFHLAADGTAKKVAEGLTYSNGVFVTTSGVVYVSEHMGKRILRYRMEGDGGLTPLQPFADIARLVPDIGAMPAAVGPDGLEVTGGGTVFVAIYGSGKILQISALGTLQKTFETGLEFVTSLALDLDANRMIVTGAHSNTEHPYKGEVREIRLDR
jgi:sugar lactone lactonase YvrE